MNIIKRLLQSWKRRNWFKLELNPDSLQKGVWYSVSCEMKNVDGKMRIENYTLYQMDRIKEVRIYKRKLITKEINKLILVQKENK